MYIPKANEENRVSVMRALMVSQPLGTLVTLGASGLFASHIPMVLEDDGSQFGVLKGHMSRANRQWRDFVPTVDALANALAVAPTRGLAWTKAAIRGSWQHSLAEQLDIERDAQSELGRSIDYAEGVAAFVEKRTPRFTGR